MIRWKRDAALITALALSSVVASRALAEKPDKPVVAKPGAQPKDTKGGPGGPHMEDRGKGKPDEKGHGKDHAEEHGMAHGKDGAKGGGAERADEGKGDEASRAARRAERQKRRMAQRAEMRKRITGALKGRPMAMAMKQELKRHARRVARLERIKELAEAAKDEDSLARVAKLMEKENARHEKWMAHYDTKMGDKAGSGDKATADTADKKGDEANHDEKDTEDESEGQGQGEPEGE